MREILVKLQNILSSFLGEPKNEITNSGQCQFPCPNCIDTKGENERHKFNLEVNCIRGVYRCWSCSEYNDEMHGSIRKLFKLYGNEKLWKEYVDIILDFKKSKLYDINFSNEDFNIGGTSVASEALRLPIMFKRFNQNGSNSYKPLKYLFDRGIGWDIINKYNIGYTDFDTNQKELSTRIIIPSYNEYDELNYWTGRDYSGYKGKQKYFNPKVERKDIIFGENKIQWDADINICEGPMDAIVLPNSIPLLGKSLKNDFKIYESIFKKAHANINIFLDGDAKEDVKKIYKLLNQGHLKDRIYYIPVDSELDPSEIYKQYGKYGIVQHLKNREQFSEIELF